MELRVLQYFLTVAREMTISGAAEELHITQPTLSRQMKELEEEIGKPLFIRGNRSITLTDEGLLLKNRAIEIMSLVEKTQAELSMNSMLSGDIYIGAGESEGMRIIAKVINKMQEKYPQIKFHIYSGNAEDVMNKLDNGLLDFGILMEPTNMSKYDFLRLPVKNIWGILMRKDDSLASLQSITRDILKDLPLICSNQRLVKNELAGWLGGNDRKLNIISTYNLLYNASLIAQEGHSYVLCFDNIIYTGTDSLLCFKPLEPKLEAGINVVWRKYQLFSKSSEEFLKLLKEEVCML